MEKSLIVKEIWLLTKKFTLMYTFEKYMDTSLSDIAGQPRYYFKPAVAL